MRRQLSDRLVVPQATEETEIMKPRLLLLLLVLIVALVMAQEEEQASEPEETTTEPPTEQRTVAQEEASTGNGTILKKEKDEDFFDVESEDWGSYYDPQNVFCGKYDCYKILGFDYESFGKQHPDKKTITKRYRALSREWHPDKSKHRNAKNRFVKISRAYEVLTDEEQRKECTYRYIVLRVSLNRGATVNCFTLSTSLSPVSHLIFTL